MTKSHSALALTGLSCCIFWTLLAAAPARAQLISDEAARVCAQSTAEETITSCTAVIDAGNLTGRQLAAAYAQRGYARTLKRSLTEAEADLDQAIKTDPDYPGGYANRANFWIVTHKYDRAMADAEQAVRLDPNLPIVYFVRGGAALTRPPTTTAAMRGLTPATRTARSPTIGRPPSSIPI